MTNPVGYQEIEIPMGYSIVTPTFKGVGNEIHTLADIIVLNENHVEFDGVRNTGDDDHHVSNQKIKVSKVYNAEGTDNYAGDIQYTYIYNANLTGSATVTKKWDKNAGVVVNNGEGLIVNNLHKSKIYFRVAGEVAVEPLVAIPTGYSIVGNFTPVDMTLADITVLNENGVEFDGVRNTGDDDHHVSNQKIKVSKVYNAEGTDNYAGDIQYTYIYNANLTGSATVTKKWDKNAGVEVKAGEALIVNNLHKSTIYFKLKKPIEK